MSEPTDDRGRKASAPVTAEQRREMIEGPEDNRPKTPTYYKHQQRLYFGLGLLDAAELVDIPPPELDGQGAAQVRNRQAWLAGWKKGKEIWL